MKKTLFLISIIISACSFNASLDSNIKGSWMNESETSWRSFTFRAENKCGFSVVSKKQKDGIGSPCTYVLRGTEVEITLSKDTDTEATNTILLKYNEEEKSLRLFDPQTMKKPIVFSRI